MNKLKLRYSYSGSKSGEKPETCFDIVGHSQACITFTHDGSKESIKQIEEFVETVNRSAELEEMIQRGVEEFEIGGKPSTALGRSVQSWRDDARALLDKLKQDPE